MSAPEGFVSQLQVVKAEAGILVRKALEEARDLRQFADAERRRDLWHKGMGRIRMLGVRSEYQINRINIQADWQNLENGVIEITVPDIPIFGYIFPEGSRVFFIMQEGKNQPLDIAPPDAVISSISYGERARHDEEPKFPQHGYSKGNSLFTEFAPRSPEDEIQHGGIHLTPEGDIEIVDYNELMQLAAIEQPDHVLIQSEWYMDSANKEAIAARSNLHVRNCFNAIGLITTGNRKILFSISTHPFRKSANEELSTIAQMAAFADMVAGTYNNARWELAGVDFYNGGTSLKDLWNFRTLIRENDLEFRKPFFAVYLPGGSAT